VTRAANDTDARLGAAAASAMRNAIALAGGREVCFTATLDEEGALRAARVVARGDVSSVLALPGFAERGQMLVHNHPSGVLEPSEADLQVAARVHDDGIGFAIVDNDVTAIYVVVEVPLTAAAARLDPRAVGAALGAGGAIAARLDHWEDRPSQRAMAERITRLYNGGGVALFEAGTGVGKSMGYLLPALRWAAANKERTVVSTNTINLQEQLVGKDLPFLAEALTDQPVRFALLKGWHNYLCLQRLEQASDAPPGMFDDAHRDEIGTLRDWARRTTDGSLSDLGFQPRAETWDEVAAESDLCTRMQCPHFNDCFLFRARRAAAAADVIVVNHHLLLSDLAVRRAAQNWADAAVLPAYSRLVIDEGHHLEDAAVAHLGTSVTRRALERLLARLDRRGRGLLAALVQRLSAQDDLLSTASLDLVHARLAPAAHAAREKGALVFDLLATVMREDGRSPLRLTADFAQHPAWRAGLDAALTDLQREFAMLREGLRHVRERLETDERRAEALAPLLSEIRGVTRRLDGIGDGLTRALRPADDGPATVRWLEARGKEGNVAAVAVPLDVASVLREDLFERVSTAIVTSATLAADGRFDFLTRRLGLDAPELEPETAIFPSPFDYASQAILAIPQDIPAPNLDAAGHRAAVAGILRDVAAASDGGLFALFTSHADVRAAAESLRSAGADARWLLLVHGDEPRDVLLRRFRESGRAILLGTTSFWEGVDVAGRALRALVIAKLPFRVPTEPITAAQCEAIEAAGGDAFAEYMLPNATLRLKQGAGRLIRRTTDRGAIVLADPRVLTKGYGEQMLDALPPAERRIAPWAALRRELEHFYAQERA